MILEGILFGSKPVIVIFPRPVVDPVEAFVINDAKSSYEKPVIEIYPIALVAPDVNFSTIDERLSEE